jgi:hypothetical protein
VLNQSTPSSVANATVARLRHGPRRRIASVLNRPITVTARALSSPSPTLPTDLMPAFRQSFGAAAGHASGGPDRPDRQIDLRLAQEPPVVDDAEQEARQHQPDRRLRIDPRPPFKRIEPGHLRVQPSEIEHPIDARKDMVVRDQVPQRAADEELQLPPHPSPQHSPPPAEPRPDEGNQDAGTFSTAPACTGCAMRSRMRPRSSVRRWRPC